MARPKASLKHTPVPCPLMPPWPLRQAASSPLLPPCACARAPHCPTTPNPHHPCPPRAFPGPSAHLAAVRPVNRVDVCAVRARVPARGVHGWAGACTSARHLQLGTRGAAGAGAVTGRVACASLAQLQIRARSSRLRPARPPVAPSARWSAPPPQPPSPSATCKRPVRQQRPYLGGCAQRRCGCMPCSAS